MSEPLSRQALTEAVKYLTGEFGPSPPHYPDGDPEWPEFEPLALAAQAILDAPPLEWCEVHWSPRANIGGICQDPKGYGRGPCQFQTYVRIKVGE